MFEYRDLEWAREFIWVLWGYKSENSLSGVYSYLRRHDIEVYMLPCNTLGLKDITRILRKKKYLLVSSAHPCLDLESFKREYPESQIEYTPLELMSYERPSLAAFYTHDLLSPLYRCELPCLERFFDLILWPFPRFSYATSLPVVANVGYGTTDEIDTYPEELSYPKNYCIFPVSDFTCYSRLGPKAFLGRFEGLFALPNLAIKLPNWDGASQFEDYLRCQGLLVVPSKENTRDWISRSEVVISNGESGIVMDAVSLGKPVISIQNSMEQVCTLRDLVGFDNPSILVTTFDSFVYDVCAYSRFLRPSKKLKALDMEIVLRGMQGCITGK